MTNGVAVLTALCVVSMASAQVTITLPSLPGVVRQIRPLLPPAPPKLKNVFPDGYDAAEACASLQLDGDGDLEVSYPARFPEPKRSDRLTSDYRLNCPQFVIERVDDKSLTIIGLSPAQLRPFLKLDSYDLPYLFRIDDAELLFGEGSTLIPTVREGQDVSDSLVVAVRQPGTALQPIVFDGGVQGIIYDPAKPLEIFQKARFSTPWQRMVWDAANRVILFDITYPFPAN